jgi:CubicO group peptidase (beta-lactamase class C family)
LPPTHLGATVGVVTTRGSAERRLGDAAAALHEWSRSRDWSGSVLLTQRGETLLESCAGEADRAAHVPVRPTTRFGLASVTKMFTAVAVADQVAAGQLRFDARVVDVLPPERRPSTLLPEVTVHHLLCHTSGIADYAEEDPPDGSDGVDYADLWVDRPTYEMQRPADFLPLFGDLPPYWPPGERYWYSNAGYVLLGLVVEEVSGTPYAELVQDRVLERAGMGDSGFFRLDEPVPDLAVGYVRTVEGGWRSNHFSIPVVGGPDGGAQSTCRDLDRFLTAYDTGPLLGDLHDVVVHRHADAGEDFSYGYGVLFYPDGRLGHGGSDPGVETSVFRWPDHEANLVVLGNTEGVVGDVRDLVVGAWRPETRGRRA